MKYFYISIIILTLTCLTCGKSDDLNPIFWQTDCVSLEADNRSINASGKTYTANVPNIEVSSDRGFRYCTLEVSLQENDVEMRIYMYFKNDGTDWWSYEIRTYDGQQVPDWIDYTGTFFKSGFGTTFIDDINLTCDPGNEFSGKIHFEGLRLKAF